MAHSLIEVPNYMIKCLRSPQKKESDKLVDHSQSHQNHATVASEQISKFINRQLKVETVWAFNQDRSSITYHHRFA